MTGIFLWTTFCQIIIKTLERTSFDGGLQIYLLGIPLVIAIIVSSPDKKMQVLTTNINNFHKGEEVALQIRYFE